MLTRLPAELHYLIEPVLRCGFRTEADVLEYLERATPEQMAELARIAERVLARDDYPLVLGFIDEYPFPEHQESAQLYFFFGALDHAGLEFDRVRDEPPRPKTMPEDTGSNRWQSIPADKYDDRQAFNYYVDRYWTWHMTGFEKRCQDLGRRFETAKAQRFSTDWARGVLAEWQSAADDVHAALAQGLSSFLRSVQEKVRDGFRTGAMVPNRCPRCARIARTPRAHQCLWCGHDWHH